MRRKKTNASKARDREYVCVECKKPIIGAVMHYGNAASSTNAYCRLCFNP